MKKLFISQPMKDKTKEEILEQREIAIARATKLCGEEVEVIDSYFENAPQEARPLWYIGQSIILLSQADYVYFANGWEHARGCIIEHECALRYDVKII